MSTLASIISDDEVKQETNTLGGGQSKFGVVESGLYNGTIDMAYIKTAASGAVAIALTFLTDEGRQVKEDLWVQSGTAKGNKTFYVNKKGEKHSLPGFTMANQVCLLADGKELNKQATELKIVKIYSWEQKTDVPTEVEVLVDLLGKPIIAGIVKQTVDKKQKGDDNQYHPTGEYRDENTFDKFFRDSDRLTTVEIRGGSTGTPFADGWETANKGKTRDKTDKSVKRAVSPVSTNSAFSAAASGGSQAATAPAEGGLFTAAG